MKRLLLFVVLFTGYSMLYAVESVNIRTTYMDGKTDVKKVSLDKISDSQERLKISKESLGEDIKYIDVIPNFCKAKKGDPGYWVHARGIYGNFDKENGEFSSSMAQIPIWGIKTADKTFWANVISYRFDYSFNVVVKGGKYEIFSRFDIEGIRKWFDPYQDIVIDFNFLEGEDANYSGMGRGYRRYQIENGKVRTIKDRMKDYPTLKYLSEAMVIRIQTHAAKPWAPDNKSDYTNESEMPIVSRMPFGITAEFMEAIKNAGVDKACFCSAGWNYGGYDGGAPQHFPVCEVAGGEEELRRMITKAKNLGFLITAHSIGVDSYKVSPMWDEQFVGKKRDGSLDKGGIWSGGQSYLVCQRAAYEQWIPKQLEKIHDLGFEGPHYIDVYSATYPRRCCDPNHPATPEVMAEYQNKILALSKKIFGGAASECGYDHVAGNLDYVNYVGTFMKAYTSHPERYPLVKGIYPLWEIVYHGIILYTSDRMLQNHTRGNAPAGVSSSADPRWMEGDGVVDPNISLKIIEFGGRPIFYTSKFADVPRIKKAYDEFKPVMHLQKELIYSHEEIAPNVFITKYEDGTEIVSNYNDNAFTYKGFKVAPLFYRIYESTPKNH